MVTRNCKESPLKPFKSNYKKEIQRRSKTNIFAEKKKSISQRNHLTILNWTYSTENKGDQVENREKKRRKFVP